MILSSKKLVLCFVASQMNKSGESEVVTLSSDSEDDYSNKGNSETSSSSPPWKISNDSSPSFPVGLSGFINDVRMLSEDIERLKASNKNLTQMLERTQIKLNKASYEWCTSQAQLANDEMQLKTQDVQILNLIQQVNDIRFRNHDLDSKFTCIGQGLGTLFQTSTKLTNENTEEDEDDIGTFVTSGKEIVRFKTKPQRLQVTKSLAISCKIPDSLDRVGDQHLRQKLLHTNLKLENLHAKFTKRMAEKEQFQREIKTDLEEKNKQLHNIGQLMLKRNLKVVLPKLDLQQANTKSKDNGHKGRPRKSQLNPNSTTPTNVHHHVRDLSVPIKKGYGCICGEHFSFIATLHYHLGKHDASSKKFVCDVCSKSFLYFHSLSQHLRDNHKRFFPRNTHGCRTCGAVFPSRNEFMKGWE